MKKVIFSLSILSIALLFSSCSTLFEIFTIVTLEKVFIVDSNGNALEDAEMDTIKTRNLNHFSVNYGFDLEYGQKEYKVALGYREHTLGQIRANVEMLLGGTATHELTNDDTYLTITFDTVDIN